MLKKLTPDLMVEDVNRTIDSTGTFWDLGC